MTGNRRSLARWQLPCSLPLPSQKDCPAFAQLPSMAAKAKLRRVATRAADQHLEISTPFSTLPLPPLRVFSLEPFTLNRLHTPISKVFECFGCFYTLLTASEHLPYLSLPNRHHGQGWCACPSTPHSRWSRTFSELTRCLRTVVAGASGGIGQVKKNASSRTWLVH